MRRIHGAVETILTDVRNAMKDMNKEERDAFLTTLFEELGDISRSA